MEHQVSVLILLIVFHLSTIERLSISCLRSIGYVGNRGFGFVFVSSLSLFLSSPCQQKCFTTCYVFVQCHRIHNEWLIISIFFLLSTRPVVSARSKVRGTLEIYHAYIRDSDTSSRGDADWEIVDNNSTTVSVSVFILSAHSCFCFTRSLKLIVSEESYSYLIWLYSQCKLRSANVKFFSFRL